MTHGDTVVLPPRWRRCLAVVAATILLAASLAVGSVAAAPAAYAHTSSYCGHSPWHMEGLFGMEWNVQYVNSFRTSWGQHYHNYRHNGAWIDPWTGEYYLSYRHSASRHCPH
jgi:hypothetical protein